MKRRLHLVASVLLLFSGVLAGLIVLVDVASWLGQSTEATNEQVTDCRTVRDLLSGYTRNLATHAQMAALLMIAGGPEMPFVLPSAATYRTLAVYDAYKLRKHDGQAYGAPAFFWHARVLDRDRATFEAYFSEMYQTEGLGIKDITYNGIEQAYWTAPATTRDLYYPRVAAWTTTTTVPGPNQTTLAVDNIFSDIMGADSLMRARTLWPADFYDRVFVARQPLLRTELNEQGESVDDGAVWFTVPFCGEDGCHPRAKTAPLDPTIPSGYATTSAATVLDPLEEIRGLIVYALLQVDFDSLFPGHVEVVDLNDHAMTNDVDKAGKDVKVTEHEDFSGTRIRCYYYHASRRWEHLLRLWLSLLAAAALLAALMLLGYLAALMLLGNLCLARHALDLCRGNKDAAAIELADHSEEASEDRPANATRRSPPDLSTLIRPRPPHPHRDPSRGGDQVDAASLRSSDLSWSSSSLLIPPAPPPSSSSAANTLVVSIGCPQPKTTTPAESAI